MCTSHWLEPSLRKPGYLEQLEDIIFNEKIGSSLSLNREYSAFAEYLIWSFQHFVQRDVHLRFQVLVNFLTSDSSPHVEPTSFATEICVSKFLAVGTIIFHLRQALLNSWPTFDAIWSFDAIYQRFRYFFARRSHFSSDFMTASTLESSVCSIGSTLYCEGYNLCKKHCFSLRFEACCWRWWSDEGWGVEWRWDVVTSFEFVLNSEN